MRALFLIFLMPAFSVAAEQKPSCLEPLTQQKMNLCAAESAQNADQDLNLAYELALARARSLDMYLPAGQERSEDMLRAAQRVWIEFRDRACAAESTLVRGGSMQPLLFHSCVERETRHRAESLRFFGEVN